MKSLLKISLLLLFLSSLCFSCGNGTADKVSERIKDHEAFALGEKHAAELISLGEDESAVQDKILDVHARTSNIREKVSAQSAADYERGFVSYIKENSDSLSAILF